MARPIARPLGADLAEILRGEWDMGMDSDDLNFVGVQRGTREQRLKNRQKSMIFAVFGLHWSQE